MGVQQMLGVMSSAELAEWMAFFQVEDEDEEERLNRKKPFDS